MGWRRRRCNKCHAAEVFRDKISDEVHGISPENNCGILLSGVIDGVVEEILNQSFSNGVSTGVVNKLWSGADIKLHDEFCFASVDESS